MFFVPLLTGLALVAFSLAQADPTESAEGVFLALTATVLLAATTAAARADGTKRLRWPVCVACLTLLAFYFLHQGPQRGGIVLAVLVVGWLGALVLSWPGLHRTSKAVSGGATLPPRAALSWSLAAAFGVQAASAPDAALGLATGLRTLATGGTAEMAELGAATMELAAWPLVAGLAIGVLGTFLGRLGLLLGAGHCLFVPGVDALLAAGLAAAAVVTVGIFRIARRRDASWSEGLRIGPGVRRVLDAYGFLLLFLALPVLLLAAYPWQRPAPWSALPDLATPPSTARVLLDRGPVPLTAESRLFRVELEEVAPSRALLVDSVLVHGADLTGETVAYVRILDRDGEMIGRVPLVAGEHTADWAAARPDVAARPGFVSPPPWTHAVAPSGRFFSRRFRAVFARGPRYLEANGPDAVAALEVVRSVRLPAETRIHLHRLEIR